LKDHDMTEAITQSLDEINAAIADLQAKAAEVRQQARAAAIERCNFIIQEFDLAAFEMKFSEAKAKAKKPRKAKEAKAPTHRGPNGEVWTESPKGRKPNWVKALITSGGDLEQYRIPAQV
jgi:DNA-binding protein H-NS